MLQELDKRLGVNLKLDITTISDYNTKFNTLVAGSNLPDVFWVGQTPNLVDFLQQSAADLTPYLAGDAVKNYPNLANLNTNTWKGAIFGGAIMGLPSPLGAMGNIIQINKTRWDAEIGADVRPKNAEDLKRMLVQLTNPQQNKWAMGSGSTDPYGVLTGWFSMMYGAPNGWGMENGKLVNYKETEAFKQSIVYLRDLVAAGVFHPKAATYDAVAAKGDNLVGQFVGIQGTFYGNHVDMWNRGAAANPKVNFTLLEPISHNGGQVVNWLSAYIWPRSAIGPGIWAFKKAPKERIEELLRVWNWICGPFGSQERLLWEYGVEGVDWNRGPDGNIVQTQRGAADSTFVPIRFGPHSPDMLYNPATPDYGPTMQKLEQTMIPLGIMDATVGIYSPTDGAQGRAAELDVRLGDGRHRGWTAPGGGHGPHHQLNGGPAAAIRSAASTSRASPPRNEHGIFRRAGADTRRHERARSRASVPWCAAASCPSGRRYAATGCCCCSWRQAWPTCCSSSTCPIWATSSPSRPTCRSSASAARSSASTTSPSSSPRPRSGRRFATPSSSPACS